MVEDRIGYRYAKSLYEIATEQGLIESVKRDMDAFVSMHDGSRDFQNFLKSPIISAEKKQEALSKIISSAFESTPAINMAKMTAKKGREMYLPYIAKAFIDIYEKENGIIHGVLTTSYDKVSKKLITSLTKKVEENTGSKLILQHKVDESLIGGFVLEIDDKIYDGSVKSALRNIRREFNKRV